MEEREMRSEGNLPELGEARRRGWGMATAAAPLWWSRIWWRSRRLLREGGEGRGAGEAPSVEGEVEARRRLESGGRGERSAAVWRVKGVGRVRWVSGGSRVGVGVEMT